MLLNVCEHLFGQALPPTILPGPCPPNPEGLTSLLAAQEGEHSVFLVHAYEYARPRLGDMLVKSCRKGVIPAVCNRSKHVNCEATRRVKHSSNRTAFFLITHKHFYISPAHVGSPHRDETI